MYQCIGVKKHGWFTSSSQGCGQKWSFDSDRCPNCYGYLIPESMVTAHHRENMRQQTDDKKQQQVYGQSIDEVSVQKVIHFLKHNQYDYELSENDDSIKKVITWLLKTQ